MQQTWLETFEFYFVIKWQASSVKSDRKLFSTLIRIQYVFILKLIFNCHASKCIITRHILKLSANLSHSIRNCYQWKFGPYTPASDEKNSWSPKQLFSRWNILYTVSRICTLNKEIKKRSFIGKLSLLLDLDSTISKTPLVKKHPVIPNISKIRANFQPKVENSLIWNDVINR